MDVTYFNQLKRDGRKGEQLVADYFTAIGFEVDDVSNNKAYFSKDIDLIIKNREGAEAASLEVKADKRMAATGNVCVETIGNAAANKKGWIYYTEASHIAFVDMTNSILHLVRRKELLNACQQPNGFRVYRRQQLENGVYPKEAEMMLIPISALKKFDYYMEVQL